MAFLMLHVVAAQGEEPTTKSLLLVISNRNGLNGTDPSRLVVTVNQGDRVEIKFVMDAEDRKYPLPSNKHIVEVAELGIYTEEINPSRPEATLAFTADRAGTFTIMCSGETWDCPGHDLLQNYKLVVKGKEELPKSVQTTPPAEEETGANNFVFYLIGVIVAALAISVTVMLRKTRH